MLPSKLLQFKIYNRRSMQDINKIQNDLES